MIGRPKPEIPIPQSTMYQLLRKSGVILRPKHQPRTMTVEERSWLACAIDSEGHIRVEPPFRLYVSNTDGRFIEHVAKITGIDLIIKAKPQVKGWKTSYKWQLGELAALRNILAQISPYLIIKKKQAEKILVG